MGAPAGRSTSEQEERAMGEINDFSEMDDPAFLAERTRVREAIQVLTERYQALTVEFDRRASAKWKAEVR
jgi:hypothetical protein